jgi:hypothetical protein
MPTTVYVRNYHLDEDLSIKLHPVRLILLARISQTFSSVFLSQQISISQKPSSEQGTCHSKRRRKKVKTGKGRVL